MPRKSKAKSEKASAQERPQPDTNEAPRASQALRLRRLGYTYADIADRCGYSDESGARKAVKRANARILRDDAQALVGFQLDMIDSALSVVMEAIQKRDKGSLWAVDRLVPLLKRQADLMGLDAKPENAGAGLALVSVPIAADVLEAL